MSDDLPLDSDAVEWMINQIDRQLASLELDGYEHEAERWEGMGVCRRIVERVAPEEQFDFDAEDPSWRWRATTILAQVLGLLRAHAQLARFLGPAGPQMPASAMHPMIWERASRLWTGGHYAMAVNAASIIVNAQIQAKTARTDISDKELMNEVFSSNAASPGHPRLRWRGHVANKTQVSMKDGIRSYAVGVSLAIRNPAAHEPEEIDRQVALEERAALSVLARWVDQCDVDWGEGF